MSVFEFVLRLVGILVPAARKKREEDAEARERPLLDVDEERQEAEEAARKNWN